jgi:hypothetical protein
LECIKNDAWYNKATAVQAESETIDYEGAARHGKEQRIWSSPPRIFS